MIINSSKLTMRYDEFRFPLIYIHYIIGNIFYCRINIELLEMGIKKTKLLHELPTASRSVKSSLIKFLFYLIYPFGFWVKKKFPSNQYDTAMPWWKFSDTIINSTEQYKYLSIKYNNIYILYIIHLFDGYCIITSFCMWNNLFKSKAFRLCSKTLTYKYKLFFVIRYLETS